MTVTIYYLFLAFVLLLAFLDFFIFSNVRSRFYLYAILFAFIVIFIGLRYQTGLDWLFYNDLFNGESFSLAIEPGYYLLSFISSFFMNYWIYQALITVFLLICLKSFFEDNVTNYLFCIGIFFLYQFIFVTEALRQIIALSVVLIAYKKFYESKIYQFYVFVAVAILFHVSAVIVLMIVPFLRRGNVYILKFMTMIGIVLAIFNVYPVDSLIKLLSVLPTGGYLEKIKWYSQDDFAGSVLTISLIFKIFIVFLFDTRFKFIKTESNYLVNSKAYDFIYISLYLMVFMDVYLGRFGTISTRLDVYFIPCFLVALSYLINQFKQGISRFLFFGIVMGYFTINYFGIMDGYYFNNFYSPYQNYTSEFLSPGNYSDRGWDVKYYFSNKESLQ